MDLQVLDDYVARGLLSCRRQGPLAIYNYTERCTYDRAWDEITLACRGLVVNTATGALVANPWPKFFNHHEPDAPAVHGPPSEVTVKHDGSLGIGYLDPEGRCRWATRGSFDSEQAQAANALWARHHARARWPEEITPLVEIIHPITRVIVDYDFEGLILLGARTLAGRDLPYTEVAELASDLGLRHVERVELAVPELEHRARTMDHTEEGFVARWGDHRVKYKSAAYLALARLLQGMNERRVADFWYAREPLPPQVPEETRQWAEALMRELDAESAAVGREIDYIFTEIRSQAGSDRKAFAELAKAHKKLMSALMNRFLGRVVDARDLAYRRRYGRPPRPTRS